MKPRILFVITTDPRTSPRPAEAIRIAAGVGSWGKVDLSIYLRGSAVLAVSEEPDGLVDGDTFTLCMPLLKKSNHPVYVEEKAACLFELGNAPWELTPLSEDGFASLAAQQTYLLRF